MEVRWWECSESVATQLGGHAQRNKPKLESVYQFPVVERETAHSSDATGTKFSHRIILVSFTYIGFIQSCMYHLLNISTAFGWMNLNDVSDHLTFPQVPQRR